MIKEPKTAEEINGLLAALRLLVPHIEARYFADDEHAGLANLNAVFFPCVDKEGNVIEDADAGVLLLWEKETKWRAYIYGSGKRYPMDHASNTFESALRMGLGTILIDADNNAAKGADDDSAKESQ